MYATVYFIELTKQQHDEINKLGWNSDLGKRYLAAKNGNIDRTNVDLFKPAAVLDAKDAEAIWKTLQNTAEPWEVNNSISILTGFPRSMDIGDLIVWFDGRQERCAETGFENASRRLVYGGYTERELRKAFDKVCDPTNWKNPIDTTITVRRSDTARDGLYAIVAAVEFYTATTPEVKALGGTKYHIRAIGILRRAGRVWSTDRGKDKCDGLDSTLRLTPIRIAFRRSSETLNSVAPAALSSALIRLRLIARSATRWKR